MFSTTWISKSKGMAFGPCLFFLINTYTTSSTPSVLLREDPELKKAGGEPAFAVLG